MRVYERSVSPVLYIEWHWRGRRRQESLKSRTGHPVTDKRLAMRIAHEAARKLESEHNRAALASEYAGEGRTLRDLFDRLHAVRTWKDTAGPERFRRFWLESLGEDTPVSEITPAMVEACGKPEWSAKTLRHYRKYIDGAFRYAKRKLRWIAEPLDLDMPTMEASKAQAYTLAEVRALLPALEAVDPRAGWIGHVAWQTGRRLTAVRTMLKEHVTLHDDHAVLHFPAETDKAGKVGEAVIVGEALRLTRALMASPGIYVLGVTPPRKELVLKGWLPRAEDAADVKHIEGRGLHALKRRYATETRGMRGRDKQAGTRDRTLEVKYDRADIDRGPKLEVARELDATVSSTVSGA